MVYLYYLYYMFFIPFKFRKSPGVLVIAEVTFLVFWSFEDFILARCNCDGWRVSASFYTMPGKQEHVAISSPSPKRLFYLTILHLYSGIQYAFKYNTKIIPIVLFLFGDILWEGRIPIISPLFMKI